MKGIVVALLAGTLIGSLLTGLTYLSSADALGTAPGTNQVVAAATPVAVPVAAPAPTYVGELTGAVVPIPENVDPVLGTKKWGIRSDGVEGAHGQAVTESLHVDVENFEHNVLMDQQSTELLKVFRRSKGVNRIIRRYGGEPCDTHYYVLNVQANEDDAAPNAPWMKITLRADFASPEGRRGIEMQVYRRKNDKGELDNTPYVAQTQVGYIGEGGPLSTGPGYRHEDEAEFAVSHDQVETIRFRN